MLSVVCFKWSTPGYRSKFGPEQVNTLRRMVARNYPHPHRFVCITDSAEGIDEDIDVFDLWPDLREIPNPSGRRNPSCYARLKLFARNAGHWLGDRIVWLDLDAVITGDLSPIFNRRESFIIWNNGGNSMPYNGSMAAFDAGARPQLWEDFDPSTSPQAGQRMGYFGSDQAWIAAKLGPHEATWTKADGVYSFRVDIAPRGARNLPKDARIVFFHGKWDPWQAETQRMAPWIRDHYR